MNPLTEAAFILAFCILPGGGECPTEAIQSGQYATLESCQTSRELVRELAQKPEDFVVVTDCEVKE